MSQTQLAGPVAVGAIHPLVTGAASPGLGGQELLEGLEDMLWLAGGQVLQPGAQVLLEALGQPTRHRADIPTTPRQHPVPGHVGQEVPEDRKDVALHGLGLSGAHRGHQHCQKERGRVTPPGPVSGHQLCASQGSSTPPYPHPPCRADSTVPGLRTVMGPGTYFNFF